MKVKPTITAQELPAAEMAEQQVNPNPNEFQFQFTTLYYEDLVPPELPHRTASGNVGAAATEKKEEALELLELTESTLVADVCKLSKVEYFT